MKVVYLIIDDDVMHNLPLPRCLRQWAVPPEFNATFFFFQLSTEVL